MTSGIHRWLLMLLQGLLALSLLGGCGWANFEGSGDDDDDDAFAPTTCTADVCVSGGVRTLDGPALRAGRWTVHSTAFEHLGRACGHGVCVAGGIEP
jgi:hypothetical protein